MTPFTFVPYTYSKRRYFDWLLSVQLKAMLMNAEYTEFAAATDSQDVADISAYEYVGTGYARVAIPTLGRSVVSVPGGYSIVLPTFVFSGIPLGQPTSGGVVLYVDDSSDELLGYNSEPWTPDGYDLAVVTDPVVGVMDLV